MKLQKTSIFDPYESVVMELCIVCLDLTASEPIHFVSDITPAEAELLNKAVDPENIMSRITAGEVHDKCLERLIRLFPNAEVK